MKKMKYKLNNAKPVIDTGECFIPTMRTQKRLIDTTQNCKAL